MRASEADLAPDFEMNVDTADGEGGPGFEIDMMCKISVCLGVVSTVGGIE